MELTQEVKNQIALVCKKQIDISLRFKQPRIQDIKKSFDLYANKVNKNLSGRYNVPIPIMGGFVDTLKSKIDDAPKITFSENDETDYWRVEKANAMLERDSSNAQGQWAYKDRASKTSAIFTGRGIMKYYASSDPKYNSNLEVVDFFDFIFEPDGGGKLEKHLFCGQMNIFKTLTDLQDGLDSKLYDREGVLKLMAAVGEKDRKEWEDEYGNKVSRFDVYGLNPQINNYVGEDLYNLTEMYTNYKGKRYYVLMDYKSGIPIRVEELTQLFNGNRYPYFSWATHEDDQNFASKAPCDDIRPVAEAMKITINQMMDNAQKTNWGMKLYDKDMIQNPAELNWRPDGLIRVDTKNGAKQLDRAIYPLPNPGGIDLSINVVEFLNNYIGRATGVTADTQGAADQSSKVGIYYGNLQQVADRLGLYNKSYTESYVELGVRYLEGLDQHLTTGESVKITGIGGVRWESVKRTDFSFEKDPDVIIQSSNAEAQLDEVNRKNQTEALNALSANPALAASINPKWLVENMLRTAGFDEATISTAMDTKNEGTAEVNAKAAQCIKDIIQGKEPKDVRNATTSFVQKILDYEMDNEDVLKADKAKALRDFAQKHISIALENMMRKATGIGGTAQGIAGGQMPEMTPAPKEETVPIPNTAAGTKARSMNTSNLMQSV